MSLVGFERYSHAPKNPQNGSSTNLNELIIGLAVSENRKLSAVAVTLSQSPIMLVCKNNPNQQSLGTCPLNS